MKVEGTAGVEPAVIPFQVGQVPKRPRLYLNVQLGQPTTKPSDLEQRRLCKESTKHLSYHITMPRLKEQLHLFSLPYIQLKETYALHNILTIESMTLRAIINYSTSTSLTPLSLHASVPRDGWGSLAEMSLLATCAANARS